MMCSELVEAVWLGADGRVRKAGAVLEEVCASSACLQMEEVVPTGAAIRFRRLGRGHAASLRGVAISCNQDGDLGYFLEVQLDEDSPWRVERWRPAHLLDPAELLPGRTKGETMPPFTAVAGA